MTTADRPVLTKKDFKTDQDVRWCPGCGDYAILNSVQSAFAKLGQTEKSTMCLDRFRQLKT